MVGIEGSTFDKGVKQVALPSFLAHAQLPAVDVFHLDLFAVRVRVVFLRWYTWVSGRRA